MSLWRSRLIQASLPKSAGIRPSAGRTRMSSCRSRHSFCAFAMALLMACSRDNREQDVRQCTLEIQHQLSQGRANETSSATESTAERHDAVGGMIAACMETRGYRHDSGAMTGERCVDDVDYNPYCYQKAR